MQVICAEGSHCGPCSVLRPRHAAAAGRSASALLATAARRLPSPADMCGTLSAARSEGPWRESLSEAASLHLGGNVRQVAKDTVLGALLCSMMGI